MINKPRLLLCARVSYSAQRVLGEFSPESRPRADISLSYRPTRSTYRTEGPLCAERLPKQNLRLFYRNKNCPKGKRTRAPNPQDTLPRLRAYVRSSTLGRDLFFNAL